MVEDAEARLQALERTSARLDHLALRLDTRVARLEAAAPAPHTHTRAPRAPLPPSPAPLPPSPLAAPAPLPPSPAPLPPAPAGPWSERAAPVAPVMPARAGALTDLLGRRVLGWAGGAAVLIGLGLFLALAVARGWIDPAGRVILASLGSVGLMATGAWLFERHGRTEAAAIAVGVATAGQWATIAAAVDLYGLLAPLPGVVLALATAAVAGLLAVRWAGWPVAAVALLGGLLAPLALGIAGDTAAVAIVGVAAVAVVAVAIWQRWRWIATGAVVACLPQWLAWLAQGYVHSLWPTLAVLSWFAALGVVVAVVRAPLDRLHPAGATAVALDALAASLAALGLGNAFGNEVAATWLGLVAVGYAAGARGGLRHARTPAALGALLAGAAIALADGALAIVLHGLWLTGAWAVGALAAGLVVRRRGPGTLAQVGLGAHVGLTLVRAAQASIGAGHGDEGAVLSLAILAGTCLAAGTAARGRARIAAAVVHGLGLLAVAYLTADTLSGPALIAVWCGEATVLGELWRRGRDVVAAAGALGFLGLAVTQALVALAPPSGLVVGAPDLGAAAIALGAVAVVTLRAGLVTPEPRVRTALLVSSLGAVVYLGSIALITAFQPAAGTLDDTVLDLGVRQQGQVLLSGAWSLIGVAVLVGGLRANRAPARLAGLTVLFLAIGKVFLYDLSTLTSIYRVASLVGIGMLCLGGAFAYQRLRPAPLPDLRSTAPVAR